MTVDISERLSESKRSKNFLSRLMHEAGKDQRRYKRISTSILADIYYLSQGMRKIKAKPCVMLDISQGGAMVETQKNYLTKQYVYLSLIDLPYRFTAAIVGHSQRGYHLEFANLLPELAVEKIVLGRMAEGLPIDPTRNARVPEYYQEEA